MADNYLITGYWGEPHVTAENDRGINAGICGAGRFVLPVGERFEAECIGNNTIRMCDGKLIDNGAAAGIPAGEYVDLLIANASQGAKRNDLIVFQYERDASTSVESGRFVVVQGTETTGTPSDPVLQQGWLLAESCAFDQMPLWRVSVSGGQIADPVPLFEVRKSIADIENEISEVNETLLGFDADISDLNQRVWPIGNGGTGANTAEGAINNFNKNMNLFDFKKWLLGCGTSNGGTSQVDLQTGTITMTSTSSDQNLYFPKIRLKPNTRYILSCKSKQKGQLFAFLGDGSSPWSQSDVINPHVSFTTQADGVVQFRLDNDDDNSGNPNVFSEFMLNEGSSALPYQPFNGGYLARSTDIPFWRKPQANNAKKLTEPGWYYIQAGTICFGIGCWNGASDTVFGSVEQVQSQDTFTSDGKTVTSTLYIEADGSLKLTRFVRYADGYVAHSVNTDGTVNQFYHYDKTADFDFYVEKIGSFN